MLFGLLIFGFGDNLERNDGWYMVSRKKQIINTMESTPLFLAGPAVEMLWPILFN